MGRESFEGCRITQKELQKKRKKKEVALQGGYTQSRLKYKLSL